MKHSSFETERLIIKPTTEEDAPFIYELLNTPKWIKYIGDRNINSVEDAKAYIRNKMIPQLEKLGYSNYTLITKSDYTKIGTCGLYDREGLDGIDIGFAFLPAFEKKGFAYEASKKILDVGFDVFGIKTICAITTKSNIASQKLIEKLGLKYVRKTSLSNDKEELLLYTLEKSQ